MNRQSSPTRAGFPFWLAHPALLGCWQVLFLYHRNMGEYPMSAMIRPAVAMAIGCSLAAFIAKTILRNAHKAGLLISLWILLAFSFGNLWAVLDGAILHVGPLSLGCKKIAALILIPPAIIGGYFILRMKIQPATAGARVSKAAAVVVGVMWIVMAAQIGLGYIRRPQAQPPVADERVAAQGPLPDIYFIILDGYGRSDVLKERFGFDNSAFLAELADRGFGVYQNARSNYVQTALSLACTMNLDYLDDVASRAGAASNDRSHLRHIISDGRLWRILSGLGYRRVAFASGYEVTEIRGADFYISPEQTLTRFEHGLIDMTPLPALLNRLMPDRQYSVHRQRVIHAIEKLPAAADLDGPVFSFAHIICPHPPFVFDAQGEPIRPDKPYDDSDSIGPGGIPWSEYEKNYPAQIKFLNSRITAAIDKIYQKSRLAGKPQPIIIIQGDHGPSAGNLDEVKPGKQFMRVRAGILSACNYKGLDDSYEHSPVNVARGILSGISSLKLAPVCDKTFYSTWDRPYDFTLFEHKEISD